MKYILILLILGLTACGSDSNSEPRKKDEYAITNLNTTDAACVRDTLWDELYMSARHVYKLDSIDLNACDGVVKTKADKVNQYGDYLSYICTINPEKTEITFEFEGFEPDTAILDLDKQKIEFDFGCAFLTYNILKLF